MAHTIKGNASLLDLSELCKFAHGVEDLLDAVRKGQLSVTPELVSLALEAVDALRSLVPEATQGTQHLSASHEELREKIAAYVRPSNIGNDVPVHAEAPSPKEVADLTNDASRNRTLRVDTAKLDQMLTLTGEIAVAQGRLQRLLLDLGEPCREAGEVQAQIAHLFLELREQVMKIRMVPLQPLFEQFYRPVRDISKQHGKLTRLLVNASDVEADTTVIEHLRDPLTHLIRNALDHGIETPEVRRRAGKAPTGSISLSARQETGSLVVEISDDGYGLNRGRILETARARGLVQESAQLSEPEILDLIFQPGFSTTEGVSELSGRGVGLDVVRKNIEALRGTVTVRSKAGHGCSISLRMPLSLALIDGFAVGVGTETYVVPLDHVVECIDLTRFETSVEKEGAGIVNLRGNPVPYMNLGQHFRIPCKNESQRGVVIVESAGKKAGLLVDALYGDTQIVIKPLGQMFHDINGISGSAILGSGRVALLLDVPALMTEFDGLAAQA